MLEIHPLPTRYERFGNVGYSLEGKMPHRGDVLGVVVVFRPWEGSLAPDDAGDIIWELSNVGVGDHGTDVVPNHIDLSVLGLDVLDHHVVYVLGQNVFGEALWTDVWLGTVAGSAIVRGNDVVAGVCEGLIT